MQRIFQAVSDAESKNDSVDIVCAVISPEEVKAIVTLDTVTRTYTVVHSLTLLVIGIPGNIIVVMILHNDAIQDKFVSMFLSCVSLLDLLVLLVGLIDHVMRNMFYLDLHSMSYEMCYVNLLLMTSLTSSCSWLLATVTIYRFLYLVTHRRRVAFVSDIKVRIVVMILVLTNLFVAQYFIERRNIKRHWYLTTSTRNHRKCYLDDATELTVVRYLFQIYLPGFLVMASSILIYLHGIRSSFTLRQQYVNKIMSIRKYIGHLLMLKNVQFMVTTCVSAYRSTQHDPFDTSTPEGLAKSRLYRSIVTMLFYTGFALNFPIFFLNAQRFRKESCIFLMLRESGGDDMDEMPSLYSPLSSEDSTPSTTTLPGTSLDGTAALDTRK